MKTPRPLQQAAVDEIINHMRSKKQGTDPIVLDASVGAGKSLMLAMLAGHVSKNGGTALILARQAELVSQNADEAAELGLKSSIFCASLNLKSTYYPIIYGSEGSIYRALNDALADKKIDLLMIDEAHTVNYEEDTTMFMQIILTLQERNPKMRICGMSGSCYRGTNTIIGEFWKSKTVSNMSTETLVNEGYLVDTQFGFPDDDDSEIDFSEFEVKGDHNGNDYNEELINKIYQGEVNKTLAICADFVAKTQSSNGALIFAGSKLHTQQVKHGLELAGVPSDQIRIVTNDTKDKDRQEARKAAIEGKCKYFINIGVASTGWNVPRWTDIAYLRPVGSLVFLTQSIGRGLRPFLTADEGKEFNSPEIRASERSAILAGSRKPFAIIHDYAGVMDRLGHLYNSPMLEQAALQKAKKEHRLIECPVCKFENSEHARRCINGAGTDHRCEHFWQSIQCKKCQTHNDTTAQDCRKCGAMMRDPAKALLGKSYSDEELTEVIKMDVIATKNGGILIKYIVKNPSEEFGHPVEFYNFKTNVGKKIWYNKFLKEHIRDPQWRNRVVGMTAQAVMKNKAMFDVPTHIAFRNNDKNKFVIGRKAFLSGRTEEAV